ncbi:MAG TPA: tRNA (adenosine(37)-N6)-threonylcarbamoyltransferase complex transferase subunit TsaD [Limnochordia bacterium]
MTSAIHNAFRQRRGLPADTACIPPASHRFAASDPLPPRPQRPARILGIETSCDETAAAVVEDGRRILSNVVASQAQLHRRYGGVVPEIASRRHVEAILPTIDAALREADVRPEQVDAIAVTSGPGLFGSLLVGISAAKGLAFALHKPLIGVNHLEGHLYANLLTHPEIEPPYLCLIVSGGHTEILHVPEYGEYALVGRTLDDAAGEAFDKVARLLGLGYPGGPALERAANGGDPSALAFPRALRGEKGYDFSFSGIKTAALYAVRAFAARGEEVPLADFAASFQAAVVDMLVERAIRAVRDFGVNTLLLAGGVAANRTLQRRLAEACTAVGATLYYPPLELCTDNAAMIAAAGYFAWRKGRRSPLTLSASAHLPLAAARAAPPGATPR